MLLWLKNIFVHLMLNKHVVVTAAAAVVIALIK